MKKQKRVVAILLMVVMLFSVGDIRSFAETKNLVNDNDDFGYGGYFEGHRYEVFSDKVSTWEEAEEYCESLGGHLATITCKEENDYVYQLMINSGYQSAYFGLIDKDEEGKWKWVTE